MWTPRRFLQAFQRYAPVQYEHLLRLRDALLRKDDDEVAKTYARLEKISFDYAITEKMNPDEVLILKGDFGWSDIGAWDVLYDALSLHPTTKRNHDEGEALHQWHDSDVHMDALRNLIRGDVLTLDSANSLIYGQKGKMIAVVGISDMVIVDSPDALLICPKGKAQKVKEVVKILQERSCDEYV